MNLKTDWWKLLGILLMIYVILAGFLTPLKTGILDVSPYQLKNGSVQQIKVEAYNAHFDEAKTINAWLKFDSLNYIKATEIAVLNYNDLELTFDLRSQLPFNDTLRSATLIVDNEVDGYAVLPDAVSIKNDFNAASSPFISKEIQGIHQWTGIKFPFRNILYESIRNTFFHVAIWMALFLLSTIGAIYSVLFLGKGKSVYDFTAYAFTAVALVYGVIGLATGAVWAKFTWGAYWPNDVRLNMAAVSVLIYFAYFILRGSINDQDKAKKFSAVFNIFAYVAMIPLLLVLPRIADSLHPGVGGNPAFAGDDLDNTLRMVFYPAIIALILLGLWMAQLRIRIFKLREKQIKEMSNFT